jgi:haloacid dehalogenase superfamily, subfamily IA, variant 3 with third motif having DD or ED
VITTLFFDIGGVCLSNGWDHEQRQTIAERFSFDYDAFDARHRQVVDSLERGQLSLEEYLSWTIFYEARSFGLADLVHAIQDLSSPIQETLDLVRSIADSGRYRLMTINNESRELNEFRIEHFGLRNLFSAFFTSCYLGIVKPHPDAYRRAMEIAQRRPEECLFIDDRPMNVEVARILGIRAIHFTSPLQLATELNANGITH